MGTKKTALAKRGGKVVSAACVERERLSAPAIEPNLALAGAEAPEADYPQAPGTEYGTCVRVQMTDELDATDNDQVIGEWLLVGGKDLKAVAVANLNALAADFADAFAERMRMATKRGVPLTTAMQEEPEGVLDPESAFRCGNGAATGFSAKRDGGAGCRKPLSRRHF